MTKHFGHVPGTSPGAWFPSRQALARAGVHPPPMAGIHGNAREAADSIVMNGGYASDVDLGEVVLYTGHGGQNTRGVQVQDQTLDDAGNAGLVRSELEGLPVRVTRGFRAGSPLAPAQGFRYDGLYRVQEHYAGLENGHRVWMFHMTAVDVSEDVRSASPGLTTTADAGSSQTSLFEDGPGATEDLDDGAAGPVPVITTIVQRQIRSTAVVLKVKLLHDHRCQVCGFRTGVAGGAGYSEGAHIRALGRPHFGPDISSNVLCLCANCHVRFDKGGLYILDDLTVVDSTSKAVIGVLRTHPRHRIDATHLTHHRTLWTK